MHVYKSCVYADSISTIDRRMYNLLFGVHNNVLMLFTVLCFFCCCVELVESIQCAADEPTMGKQLTIPSLIVPHSSEGKLASRTQEEA